MTWTEIERRIAAGGDPKELWECLFLREPEIAKFLDYIQMRKAPLWFYPMCVMAAHTRAGALDDPASGKTWTSRQVSSPSAKRNACAAR